MFFFFFWHCIFFIVLYMIPLTRRYSPLCGPYSSSCGGLLPLAEDFMPLKKDFKCVFFLPFQALCVLSSTLRNHTEEKLIMKRRKNKKKKIYIRKNPKKNLNELTAQLYGHSRQGGCGVCQGISMGSETPTTPKRFNSPFQQNLFSI